MARVRCGGPLLAALVVTLSSTACDKTRAEGPRPPGASAVATPSPPDPAADPTSAAGPTPPSCDDGDGEACRREALAQAPGDPDAALDKLERGCALEDGPSCTALGSMLRRRATTASQARDEAKPADHGDARSDAERGSETGAQPAARPDIDPRGEPAKARLADAVEAFEAACRLDDPAGCDALAVQLHRGEGTTRDRERALALWKDACDRGQAGACRNLGLALEATSPARPEAAAAAMQRACDLRDPAGCTQLGRYRYDGHGLDRDLPGALEAYRAGCEGGLDLACDSAKNLALEVEDAAGPWARGMVTEKDGARVVVKMQGEKPIPVGDSVTIYEWAIRNEVRAWVEVGRVKIRRREGDVVELWVQEFEPDLRTDDYYPLLPKAGVRLQWSAPGASS